MSRELSAAMKVVEIPVESTASIFVARFMSGGSAVDLSSATGSKLFCARTRSGTAVVTDGVASFTTDGSDGKVQFPLALLVTEVRDLIVDVEVQGLSGNNLVCRSFILRVIPRAKGV